MRLRMVAAVFGVAALLVAGCGQKPGVADLYAGPAGQAGGGGGAGFDDGSGVGAGVDDTQSSAPGQPAPDAGGAGGSTGGPAGGGGGTGGGTGGGSGGGGGAGGPADRTGVTNSSIKIGIHAPVTGAAAIPQDSFRRAVGVYASHVNERGGIHGRKIEVQFRNDNFNPNDARVACKDLVQQQKVFLLIGGAGSDQIDACGRYAASLGVPYISAGVHETRPGQGSLAGARTYYAVSLTYEQQAPMITRLARQDFNGQAVGLMVADNDSLNSYFAAQRGSLQRAFGGNLKFADRVPKNIQAEAPTIAAKICNSGVRAVVWNGAPSGLINVTKAMTCAVRFIGPGVTNGLNIVATGACPQINGAQFFSPFPQLDRIGAMDPAFAPAYRKKTGSAPDDIGIALWGVEKLVGSMLQAAGRDLSRQSMIAAIAGGKAFATGVYPTAKFGGDKHFGGTAMHLLRADCGSRSYRTQAVNVRP